MCILCGTKPATIFCHATKACAKERGICEVECAQRNPVNIFNRAYSTTTFEVASRVWQLPGGPRFLCPAHHSTRTIKAPMLPVLRDVRCDLCGTMHFKEETTECSGRCGKRICNYSARESFKLCSAARAFVDPSTGEETLGGASCKECGLRYAREQFVKSLVLPLRLLCARSRDAMPDGFVVPAGEHLYQYNNGSEHHDPLGIYPEIKQLIKAKTAGWGVDFTGKIDKYLPDDLSTPPSRTR